MVYNLIFYENIGLLYYKMVFGREIKLLFDIMVDNVVEEKMFEMDFLRNLKDNLGLLICM